MTRRLPIFLTTILLLLAAVPAVGQDATLKAAAEAAGLEYNYDRFRDFQSVHAILTPNLSFSISGRIGRAPDLMFIAKSPLIGDRDKAIFLIDGERQRYASIIPRYGQFGGWLATTDEFAAMCKAKSLSLQIGGFEYDFTAQDIAKLRALSKLDYLKHS